MGGAIPVQVVLGYVRKQTGQARENKPLGSNPQVFCLSSNLSVPALLPSVNCDLGSEQKKTDRIAGNGDPRTEECAR